MTRQLTKTVSFTVLHLLVGFSVAYALTGSVAIAGGIALIEPMVNAVVFFFHERAWQRSEGQSGSSDDRAPARVTQSVLGLKFPAGSYS